MTNTPTTPSRRKPLFAPERPRRFWLARLAAVRDTVGQVLRATSARLGIPATLLTILLVLLGLLLVGIAVVQPLAPFLYPLF